jgi:hypothetical protein
MEFMTNIAAMSGNAVRTIERFMVFSFVSGAGCYFLL